jgi:hypothetical protein
MWIDGIIEGLISLLERKKRKRLIIAKIRKVNYSCYRMAVNSTICDLVRVKGYGSKPIQKIRRESHSSSLSSSSKVDDVP